MEVRRAMFSRGAHFLRHTTRLPRNLAILVVAVSAAAGAQGRDCDAPKNHHEALICAVQQRCDPTRGGFERNDCQAKIIEASETFQGEAGTAFLALLKSQAPRRGAIVAVGGFSEQLSPACHTDYDDPEKLIPVDEAGLTVQGGERASMEDIAELWELGFDVYTVQWCNKSDYIQRNAFVLLEALDIINSGSFPNFDGPQRQQEPLTEDDELIVIGGSMGGLVSRYALSYAEKNGLDHGVDLFISFDSPQQGAYIPIGIQHLTELLDGPVALAELFAPSLNSDLRQLRGAETRAARQMLLIHKNGPGQSAPHQDFEDLFQELDELGYPQAKGIRNVAIANGSGNATSTGRPVQPLRITTADGYERSFKLRYPFDEDVPEIWSGTLNIRVPTAVEATITPLWAANTTMPVFETRVNTPGVWINDAVFLGAAGIHAANLAEALGIPKELPIQTLLGPVASTIRDILASIVDNTAFYKMIRRANSPIAYATIPAGTSTKFEQVRKQFDEKKGIEAFGGAKAEPFIPTTSALGLSRKKEPPRRGVEQALADGTLDTPFDQVYFHNRETKHVEFTSEVRRWMCDEVSELTEAPYLTDIFPAQRAVGGDAFTLTARGVGLREGMSLVWTNADSGDEVTLDTDFVAGVLRAMVPAALIATVPDCPGGFCGPLRRPQGRMQISVVEQSTGLRLCSYLELLVEATRISIAPVTPVAGEPFTVTLADNWRDGCSPRLPSDLGDAKPYSVVGNTINIDTNGGLSNICTQAIRPYEVPVPIEGLPAGLYEVHYHYQHFSNQQELAALSFLVRAGIPQIDALEPASTPATAEDLDLTVRGSGFLEGGSSVLWNGSPQPTEFVDSLTLKAVVPAELLSAPGTLAITVVNQDAAGALESASAELAITDPPLQVTASSAPEITAGSGETTIVLTGQSFTENSAAYWIVEDGEARELPTRFLDSTRLEVDLPAELTATPGAYLLRVVDGDATSNTIPVTVTSDGPLVTSLPAIVGVGHGASFQPVISPGAFATVFGTGLAPEAISAETIPLPYEMGGIRVTVNGIPAALIYVSEGQINFQVPWSVAADGPGLVVVSRDGLEGETFEVVVEIDVFEPFGYFRTAGVFDPVIVHADNQLLTPENPAAAGEVVITYGTGVTTVNDPPADADGSAVDPLAQCTITPETTLRTDAGSAPVEVLYCGMTPNFVSLAQLNLKLPATLPAGANPRIVFRFGSSRESQPVTIYLNR
jgi:uncharacterized protein (TIGR03437 family)